MAPPGTHTLTTPEREREGPGLSCQGYTGPQTQPDSRRNRGHALQPLYYEEESALSPLGGEEGLSACPLTAGGICGVPAHPGPQGGWAQARGGGQAHAASGARAAAAVCESVTWASPFIRAPWQPTITPTAQSGHVDKWKEQSQALSLLTAAVTVLVLFRG